MAKKKNPLACPSCQTKLMESCCKCIGVMLTCPHCGSIYALYTDGRHRVSFDQAVRVMKETGKDLPSLYKETSEGGLAKEFE